MPGLTNQQISESYAMHGREILIFLTRRTCDAQVALDLTSETFAQAVLNRRRFRGSSEEAARAWLFGIARLRLAQYYRRGQVEQRGLRRLGLDSVSAPEDELRRVEELAGIDDVRDALASALGKLSVVQREALRLRVVDGYSYPEIASSLGVSEQTVRARVSRGLRALRDLLDQDNLREVVGID
jgi:RNA polymerase sigma-70 factor (ECF subfamily)